MMCVILDSNVVGEVFGTNRPPAGKGFFERIHSGRLRLIAGGKLLSELAHNEVFRLWWQEATRSGDVTDVDDRPVEEETRRLAKQKVCRSNDEHVVALAVVGGARLLYSNDKGLQKDFTDTDLINDPAGKVYSTIASKKFTPKKRQLLDRSSCPSKR